MLRHVLGGSLIGGVAIGLSSALEYVYFLLAGYLLPVDGFGLLSTAAAVLTILLAVLTSGIGTGVAKFIAEEGSSSAPRYITVGVGLQLACAVLLVAMLSPLQLLVENGHLGDLEPLLATILWMVPFLAVAAMLPLVFQGLGRLADFGAAQVINVLFRIAAAALLLHWGLGVRGALLAYFWGALFAIGYCAVRLRPWLRAEWPDREAVMRILRFSLPVSVSTILITLYVRADVVFLKLFLTGDANVLIGEYTAPALLARSVFYLSCGLPLALLPVVAAARRVALGDLARLLGALTAALSVTILLGPWFGEPVLALFFPDRLLGQAALLTPLLVVIALITEAYVLVTVLIALGRPGTAARGLLFGFAAFALGSRVLIGGLGPFSALGTAGVVWAQGIGAGLALGVLGWDVYRLLVRSHQEERSR